VSQFLLVDVKRIFLRGRLLLLLRSHLPRHVVPLRPVEDGTATVEVVTLNLLGLGRDLLLKCDGVTQFFGLNSLPLVDLRVDLFGVQLHVLLEGLVLHFEGHVRRDEVVGPADVRNRVLNAHILL